LDTFPEAQSLNPTLIFLKLRKIYISLDHLKANTLGKEVPPQQAVLGGLRAERAPSSLDFIRVHSDEHYFMIAFGT